MIFGKGQRVGRLNRDAGRSVMNRSDPENMSTTYEPLTTRELNAYAKRLQQGDRSLSWTDALKLAREHENERFAAHLQNVAPRSWKDR